MNVRTILLIFALGLSGSLLAAPEPPAGCPLNSGGDSLLNTEWRLLSIYGNQVPQELGITLKVGQTTLSGFGGCNSYSSIFQQIGHTGFMITNSIKGTESCDVMRTRPGGPTINVGNWEGSYIRTLQRAGSVQQIGNTLQFYSRNGKPSILLAKKYSES